MIVGYDYNGQQQFGSHLTELTANGMLYRALEDVWKVELVGVERRKEIQFSPIGTTSGVTSTAGSAASIPRPFGASYPYGPTTPKTFTPPHPKTLSHA